MPAIQIRGMTAADIALGMRLKSAAGWNQLERDWQRAFALSPTGCFVAEHLGQGVGTVVTTSFGPVGWISMMLVDETLRGQGIGRALMNAAIEHLTGSGVRSIRLDATPLGRPLYEKLGFVFDFELARYSGRPVSPENDFHEPTVEPLTDRDLPEVAALDETSAVTDRRRLLELLWRDESKTGWCVRRDGRIAGFQMHRSGANATQIGPCIARGDLGAELLNAALRRHHGQPVFVDIPLVNAAARNLVQHCGLTVQRPLYRMTRGHKIAEQPLMIWGSFGPEKG